MLDRLVRWIDRDYERKRYLSLFAFGQKLIWTAPMLAAILLISMAEALGTSPNGPLTLTILIVAMTGTILMFGLSMCRWFIGYGRTKLGTKQPKEQREHQ